MPYVCPVHESMIRSRSNEGPRTACVRAQADETLDSFYRGRVFVLQSKRGYRFALDAALLADFVRPRPGDELLDLGAGNGIISLLLSLKPFARATLIEIQGSLAALARRNLVLNGLEEKMTLIQGDFRRYRPGAKFDVVFSNPPYIEKRTGFVSASAEKAVAKHELKCDILGIMRTTARLLKKDGRAYFVYPARRRGDLERAAKASGLCLRRLRFVHPRKSEEACLFLAELGFTPTGARVLPPLVLRDARGRDTAEARRIFEGRDRGRAS